MTKSDEKRSAEEGDGGGEVRHIYEKMKRQHAVRYAAAMWLVEHGFDYIFRYPHASRRYKPRARFREYRRKADEWNRAIRRIPAVVAIVEEWKRRTGRETRR